MKISLGGKEIKGDGEWSFHSFKNQAECNKAENDVEAMYAEHEAARNMHGQIWLNTNDGIHRIYDCNLLKWCTYDETDDPQLKQLLGPCEMTKNWLD